MKRILCHAVLAAVVVFAAGICGAEAEGPGLPGSAKVYPKKVQVDTDYDGKIDRVEVYDDTGSIQKVESDTDKDGKIDEWITYKDGKAVRSEKDTNNDGKMDIWIDY